MARGHTLVSLILQGLEFVDTTKMLCYGFWMDSVLILNDRELASAKSDLLAVDEALLPTNAFSLTSSGISVAVIEKHTEMLKRRRQNLLAAIGAYESLKSQNSALLDEWNDEPGVVLVLARIFRGLSQRQLAQKLGMREQQIQRYEADRYRSISLSNFKRICLSLGVELTATIGSRDMDESGFFVRPDKLDPHELRRVLAYVKDAGWLSERETALSDQDNLNALVNYATSVRDRFGGPALLRRGNAKAGQLGTLSLHAWRARISHIVRDKVENLGVTFDPSKIGWLKDLVQLSRYSDGPLRAVELLEKKGVVLVVVSAVPGTALDGAAFLESAVPVIGLTLRHDRQDYFWFTLLHELGHVFLHLDHGLANGFFDDMEAENLASVEIEADDFASSVIVPPELWRISPARIAKSKDVVEELARKLNIGSALIFGKIRRERRDYSIFSKDVGQGTVRRLFSQG